MSTLLEDARALRKAEFLPVMPEVVPGRIIAEFASGHDALDFLRAKGRGFTVVTGINLPFAVCPLVPISQHFPLKAV